MCDSGAIGKIHVAPLLPPSPIPMVGFRVMERPIPLLMCEALDEACAAARLARELAPRLCVRSSAETPETPGCVEYHSLYPTLRLLSLAASPDRHADFFGAVFDSLAKSGATHRVLITGTADSGILEYLLLAWHRANAAYPSIKALDLCETPLRLCKAYGQRLGVPVDIRAGNVLSSGFPEPFDLICAHSFIVKFDDEARPLLFAKWAELLKPGGCVVSTVRIDPDRGVRTIAHTTDQADAFESRVLAAAADWLEALGTDVATLKHELACHAKAVISVPVATPEQLEQELEVAGFAIERLDVVDRGRAAASSGGAGGERRATYADFVARRI